MLVDDSSETPLMRGLLFAQRHRGTLLAVLLLCACILPFLPGLSGPFQLDDTVNLESIQVGDASLRAIYEATFNNASGLLRRPISNLSFVANQLAGATTPFAYKAVNLAIHLGCGFFVFLLVRRLVPLLLPGTRELRAELVAMGAAALWTIHPLQVSTALYAVQRMTQLSALFMLLSILVALKVLATPAALGKATDGFRLAVKVGLLAILALLSKENGALVPFLLLAILLSAPSASRRILTDTAGKQVFWKLAVFAPILVSLAAVAGFWTWIVGRYANRDFSVFERLLTETVVLGSYLKSFFLPDLRTMGLFLDGTPVMTASDPAAWFGVAGVLAGLLVAWFMRRKWPVLSFAIFWFMAAHLLESTIYPLELAFEHRNYLAILGFCVLLAIAVARLADLTRPRVAVVVAFAVLLTAGGMTFIRSTIWGDQWAFVLAEARHHPESIRAQSAAVVLESMYGDNASAIRRVDKLQQAHPDAFFPAAMEIDVACAVPGHVPDWKQILANVEAHPREPDIISLYKAVGLKVIRGQCQGDIRQEFTNHVDDLIAFYRKYGSPYRLQFFLMMRADLEEDESRARDYYQEAIATRPDDDGALLRYAYFELNAGNPGEAAVPVERLRELLPWWHPRAYRVAELDAHLADLRHKMTGRGPSAGEG